MGYHGRQRDYPVQTGQTHSEPHARCTTVHLLAVNLKEELGFARSSLSETAKLRVSRPVSRVLYGPGLLRNVAAIHLGRPSPNASCNLPGWSPRSREGRLRNPMPSLFGLAPDGVCPAMTVTSHAVGSYPTLSSLPAHAQAVCFLWHFPWGRPRRTLSGIVASWCPDFPRRAAFAIATPRPPGRLTRRVV